MISCGCLPSTVRKILESQGMRKLFCCGRCFVVFNCPGTIVNLINDFVWVLTFNCATNRLCSAKDFLASTCHVPCHRSNPHDFCNIPDILEANITIVEHVLHLLTVTERFLQRLDDECGSSWDNRGGCFTVLDGQLDCKLQTLVFLCGLGNIITNLLRRKTEWTNLWRQSGSSTDLTTDGTEAHVGDCGRVELWRQRLVHSVFRQRRLVMILPRPQRNTRV